MDKIVIWGPNRLEGQVSVSGAKNAALPVLASALLASGSCDISNVPRLKDIETILSLLSTLGVQIERQGDLIRLNSDSVRCLEAPYDLVNTMRASVLVLGPLVARFKKAKVSLPGGCAIGDRPINLHLDALEKLGAKITLDKGYVVAEAQELKGTKICFDTSTVTGTENIMMAAVLARGVTVLENAAKEPEIIDLANALNKMGAFITGAGTDTMIIEGVRELKGTSHSVMQDRIEAGTLLLAVAATGGKVVIQNCDPHHLDVVIEKLLSSGVKISTTKNSIFVESDGSIQKMHVQTQPYPGFPTDLQAQMMVLMTQAQGTSLMTESIFENRFNHVAELRRMGAHIMMDGRSAMIEGAKKLSGAPVMATDLRASACLVIAGLLAQGKTEISRVYHLDRGYEHFDPTLANLGPGTERRAS